MKEKHISNVKLFTAAAAFCALFLCLPPAAFARRDVYEVSLPKSAWDKLEVFEAHSLSRADKSFHNEKWRQARAEYDTFIMEFPKSEAISYALVRKGRCFQHDGKRNKAIDVYTEVLDYFPNVIPMAAPSLYFIGECHWQNGDMDKAFKAWAEMADDKDYSQHSLAAKAVNALAGNLKKQKKYAEANRYYKQVALDFRKKNPGASRDAMEQVIAYYVRGTDEPHLRDFYVKMRGFDKRPEEVGDAEEIAKSGSYWSKVRSYVKRHGRFKDEQAAQKKRYYSYWSGQMAGRFPKWDDYQIDYANFRLAADGDRAAWSKYLADQFEKYQKSGDYDRIIKWITLFSAFPKRVDHYYTMLKFDKMSFGQCIDVLKIAYDRVKDRQLARNVLDRIQGKKPDDNQIYKVVRELWHRDEPMVERFCMLMEDRSRGKYTLLRHCWDMVRRRRNKGDNIKEGLALADELTTVEKYADSAWWYKGLLLQEAKKYKEAIQAFRMCDKAPDSLWHITDCYLGMGKPQSALAQLVEIENFFKNEASKAALRIADVYNGMHKKEEYIAALRAVLKKYPGSRESSTAHQKLEKLGVKTGGAIDAD
ncbi:MAG: tetratricopeptide repeat protein [Kiritimatiellia bacterium]